MTHLSYDLLSLGLTMSAAAGSAGKEAGIDWLLIGSLFVNFIIFFGFLGRALRPIVADGLVSRKENMRKALERAEEKQKAAEIQIQEYREKLANLDKEVERILEAYKKEGTTEQAKIKQDTEKALEQLRHQTEMTIQQEFRKAQQAIRSEIVGSTLKNAKDKLQQNIGPEDQTRLVEQYISHLQQPTHNTSAQTLNKVSSPQAEGNRRSEVF